jgi:type II secretory pathway pseudopilin PulG
MQQIKARKTKKNGLNKKTRYGDTIVEAIIAISIYSIVAVLALGMMNNGLSRAQKNLESTMSRLAIDTQSDSLRYIYEAYITSLKRDSSAEGDFFSKIWKTKWSGSGTPQPVLYSVDAGLSNVNDASSCEEAIANDRAMYPVFVLNPRALMSVEHDSNWGSTGYYGFDKSSGQATWGTIAENVVVYDKKDAAGSASSDPNIKAAPLYPRLVYRTMNGDDSKIPDIDPGYGMNILSGNGGTSGVVAADGTEETTTYLQSNVLGKSEGVWVFGVKRQIGEGATQDTYDFYIRTCWNAVGSKAPSTTSTVVRLYEYKEGD